ncbi:MAG TPA: hypothetical protein VFF57_12120 [Hanamia sp.]|nr:hypothetical protein [Hanamia sp.]
MADKDQRLSIDMGKVDCPLRWGKMRENNISSSEGRSYVFHGWHDGNPFVFVHGCNVVMAGLSKQHNYVMALFFEVKGEIVAHAFAAGSVFGEI